MNEITANMVISAAGVTVGHAVARLLDDEIMLHNRNYHKYSIAFHNMREKIEQALSELKVELAEEGK